METVRDRKSSNSNEFALLRRPLTPLLCSAPLLQGERGKDAIQNLTFFYKDLQANLMKTIYFNKNFSITGAQLDS